MPNKDDTAPATKGDLSELRRDLFARFDKIDQEFKTIDKQFRTVLEYIERTGDDLRTHLDELIENLNERFTATDKLAREQERRLQSVEARV